MAKSTIELLNYDNPVFRTYVFYSAILIIKMLLMSILTAAQRFRRKAVASPEDVKLSRGGEVKQDPDVERVRRAHLNDMENILPFFIAGLLYVMTDPNVYLGSWLIRIIALFRILHTIVYAIVVVPQPARTICFFVCFFSTLYMCIRVLISFATI